MKLRHSKVELNVGWKVWYEQVTKDGQQPVFGEHKIGLLKAIHKFGSIKAAASESGLDFKKAWEMVNSMNQRMAPHEMVTSTRGGKGGTYLTRLAKEIVKQDEEIHERLRQIMPILNEGVEGVVVESSERSEDNVLRLTIEVSRDAHARHVPNTGDRFIVFMVSDGNE